MGRGKWVLELISHLGRSDMSFFDSYFVGSHGSPPKFRGIFFLVDTCTYGFTNTFPTSSSI